jgi:hypothetical protein
MADNELQIVTTLDPSGIRTGAEASSDAVKKSTSEMKEGFAETGNASQEAADKMNYSMTEARHSIMELGAETGVRMPRAVASFVASIAPVGSLLAAAFPVIAVVALIDVFSKAVDKIKEFSQSTEKEAAAWVAVDRAFLDSSDHIQQGIAEQQRRIIEYTQGPLAALEYAMKHLSSVAVQVFKDINAALDGSVKGFEENAHFWNDYGVRADDLKKFKNELEAVRTEAEKKYSGDDAKIRDAKILDAVNAATLEKIKAINREKEQSHLSVPGDMHSRSVPNWDPAILDKEIEGVTKLNELVKQGQDQLGKNKKADEDQDSAKKLDEKKQFDEQVINDDKALALKKAELQKQTAEELFQRGQITNEQLLSSEKTFNDAKYNAERDALEREKTLVNNQQGVDPQVKKTKIEALNSQLKQLDVQYQADKQKIEQEGFTRSVQDIVKAEQEQAAATKGGTQARIQIIEAAQAQLRAMGAQGTQAYKNLEKEKTAAVTEEAAKRKKIQEETAKEIAKDELVTAKSTHDQDQSRINQDKTALESKYSQGLVSARSYYNQLNSLAQQKKTSDDVYAEAEYNAQKKVLDKQEADAQGDVDKLALVYAQKKTLDDQYTAKKLANENTYEQTVLANRKKEIADWKKHLDQMNQEFETTMNGMIDGSKTFGQSMDDMFTKMVENFADKLVKMFLQWAENLIMMSVLKETTDKSDHAKSVVIDAKDAAAKAWASGMKAPWPLNMVLAPTLAAAAFTGTMAFAEKGALVPDDMLMNVHKDEMVLPAKISTPLQSALAGGGFGGNGGNSFYGSPITIQAIDGPSVQQMLDTHGQRFADHSVKSLERAYKNGRFN